ncbi:MAG: phosphoadenylyl-sulfate reductase [Pseudomonadota bacterium]
MQRTLLEEAIEWLRPQSAEARVAWVLAHMPDTHVVSSSFGVQSAVMLHLMTRARPDIPVLLMDTGYLFPETYSYIDALSERLSLNLHIYRADLSPAWQESRFGQLWEQGEEGLKKYNTLNKVEPMERALGELGARTWFAGLRRSQSDTRADLPLMEVKDGRVKTYPLADWSNRQVHAYLKAHDLPQHPLWEEGYVSVGDTHSTAKFAAGMREQDTRFPGHSRECGLHG